MQSSDKNKKGISKKKPEVAPPLLRKSEICVDYNTHLWLNLYFTPAVCYGNAMTSACV